MTARLARLLTLVITCSAFALPANRDEYIAWRARKAFAALPMHRIETRAGARAAIEQCPINDPGHLLNEAARATLLDAAAEFMSLQSTATAEQYARWRNANGWSLETREIMLEWNFADRAYVDATGVPLTDEVSAERIFVTQWKRTRSVDGGRWRITGMASDPTAMDVTVKRSSKDDDRPPVGEMLVPLAPGYGNVAGFARHWFRSDRSLEARIASGESVLDARMALIVEMENGTRLPLSMRLIFDEVSSTWRIDNAHLIWHQAPSNRWECAGMVIDW